MGRKVDLQKQTYSVSPIFRKKIWEHVYLLPVLESHIIQCPLAQITIKVSKSVFFTKLSLLKPTLSKTQATTCQFLVAVTHKHAYSLSCHCCIGMIIFTKGL